MGEDGDRRADRCRIYLGIPAEKLSVVNSDFQPVDWSSSTRLKGGFSSGMSRNGKIYILPRPLINHGMHRCKSFPPWSLVQNT